MCTTTSVVLGHVALSRAGLFVCSCTHGFDYREDGTIQPTASTAPVRGRSTGFGLNIVDQKGNRNGN
jgi:hypothetical protein